ncbi:similar to Saccharomyces cerevisiae YKL189W HYM1 Component of the RAM signaling network that is involved in regulation of Ace2p activity and cellular morphogenesis [Geotrichum candidum]|uniref:Similar to Saccharomyces cerevisiae YKL189W HYM1 Component of the RAM signaling network that is involved in regulation of Ace2p activity and cellular morphogenesis n=1 Tax=Geotrichum candidum TaxID=1173061 RepID=A0A0J9X3T4_GEOCN|nr:similar to Saccharomyces cerevisiae YKL189W HYM1 Component of the RAM signaling network that is involved in regulation of Ace2p activity and cellular morphogenesis [Geotrichum candidum]
MSFLFSRKPKTPPELVRTLNDILTRIDSGNADRRKLVDECSKILAQIKVILCGDQDSDPIPDQIALFAQEAYQSDILLLLVANLPSLEFDSRKEVVVIFSTLLRRQIGNHSPTIDFLSNNTKLFDALIIACSNYDVALTAGIILRDCIKHEALVKMVLKSPAFWTLFDTVSKAPFEIATDAFSTITDALTLHPHIAGEFLSNNQAKFVDKMNMLMKSDNYVTKRQSLKLIAQLIRQRSNYTFMTTYVNDVNNLRLVMTLMRNKSQNIKFEAFQIFKIFVANPKKTRPVEDTLIKNQVKLIDFLNNFKFPDQKKEDEQFNDEKKFVISKLSTLTPLSPGSSASTTSTATPTSTSTTPTSTGTSYQPDASGISVNPLSTPLPTAPAPVVNSEPVHLNEQILHYK